VTQPDLLAYVVEGQYLVEEEQPASERRVLLGEGGQALDLAGAVGEEATAPR